MMSKLRLDLKEQLDTEPEEHGHSGANHPHETTWRRLPNCPLCEPCPSVDNSKLAPGYMFFGIDRLNTWATSRRPSDKPVIL